MGSSQESFNLFNPYVWKHAVEKLHKRNMTWFRIKLHLWQTLRAVPCKLVGHSPYKPEKDEPEVACWQCKEYIK